MLTRSTHKKEEEKHPAAHQADEKAQALQIGQFAKYPLNLAHRQETVVGRVEAIAPDGQVLLQIPGDGPVLESVWANPADCTLVKTN
jgi:hypothetical protein